jgi:hypothetical protein
MTHVEQTLVKSVMDWENIFDDDGELLPCKDETVLLMVRTNDDFSYLVDTWRKDLEAELEAERKALLGN